MYSSCISAPLVNQSVIDDNSVICEGFNPHDLYAFNTMEIYPVDWWYHYNVDGFGAMYYNEWDLFWFQENLKQWHEVPYW